jgi:hypothetical protein
MKTVWAEWPLFWSVLLATHQIWSPATGGRKAIKDPSSSLPETAVFVAFRSSKCLRPESGTSQGPSQCSTVCSAKAQSFGAAYCLCLQRRAEGGVRLMSSCLRNTRGFYPEDRTKIFPDIWLHFMQIRDGVKLVSPRMESCRTRQEQGLKHGKLIFCRII